MSEWCGCMLITRFLDGRTRQAAWSGWHTAREGVEAELSWVGPPKESNKEQGQGGLLWAAWTWPRYCMAHMSTQNTYTSLAQCHLAYLICTLPVSLLTHSPCSCHPITPLTLSTLPILLTPPALLTFIVPTAQSFQSIPPPLFPVMPFMSLSLLAPSTPHTLPTAAINCEGRLHIWQWERKTECLEVGCYFRGVSEI